MHECYSFVWKVNNSRIHRHKWILFVLLSTEYHGKISENLYVTARKYHIFKLFQQKRREKKICLMLQACKHAAICNSDVYVGSCCAKFNANDISIEFRLVLLKFIRYKQNCFRKCHMQSETRLQWKIE